MAVVRGVAPVECPVVASVVVVVVTVALVSFSQAASVNRAVVLAGYCWGDEAALRELGVDYRGLI